LKQIADPMKPKTILIVDDEFYTADILTFVLESEGYRALGAFNGHDALQKLKLNAVDLIILDVMMPVMDGAELARALQGDETLGGIPVLVTSALSEPTVRRMFTHYEGFLRKPFLMEAVVTKVQDLLAGSASGAAPGETSERDRDRLDPPGTGEDA
jgi:CheY-like chemotaxis protein